MKEPHSPATFFMRQKRRHPRLLLEHDDVSIMRQVFSAQRRPLRLRRKAPSVASYANFALAGKKKDTPPPQPAAAATLQAPLVSSVPAPPPEMPMIPHSLPQINAPSAHPTPGASTEMPLIPHIFPQINAPSAHPTPGTATEMPLIPHIFPHINVPSADSTPGTSTEMPLIPHISPQINPSIHSPPEPPTPSPPRLPAHSPSSMPTPPGMSMPSLTPQSNDVLPTHSRAAVQRNVKSIRRRPDPVTWYYTSSRDAIATPSVSPILYSHELQHGDLHLHKSESPQQLQSWVWDGLQWVDIKHGDEHPKLPGYHLKLLGDEPNWVTRKTAVDNLGRAKKAAMLARS